MSKALFVCMQKRYEIDWQKKAEKVRYNSTKKDK